MNMTDMWLRNTLRSTGHLAVAATLGVATANVSAAQLSVPSQFSTIQGAINAAQDGDTVTVAAATYFESLDLLGKRLTLRGDGAESTVLHGAGLSAPILTVGAATSSGSIVEGFAFVQGEGGVLPNCAGGRTGGAVYLASASLTISECRFSQNAAGSYVSVGGAIYAHGGARLIVDHCEFTDNGIGVGSFRTAFGGSIAACLTEGGSVQVIDCIFSGNMASHGASIYQQAGTLEVVRSTFANNDALSAGGGITASECGVTLRDSSFSLNRGSAARLLAPVAGTITGCTFTGNTGTTGAGLGITGHAGPVTVSWCRFEQNSGSHGGGLHMHASDDSVVQDCSFLANVASFGAGANITAAVNSLGIGSTVTVSRCRFEDNQAGFGGGLHCVAQGNGATDPSAAPTVQVFSSVFLRNTAGPCCGTGNIMNSCYLDGLTQETYHGGGADMRQENEGRLVIANSVFVANTGVTSGGLHVATCNTVGAGPSVAYALAANLTVVGNSPDGVHLRAQGPGTLRISNAIIRENIAEQLSTTIGATGPGGPFVRVDHSNISGGGGVDGNIDMPPLFVDTLGGNYALSANSPGIDAGDNSGVPTGVIIDLAGNPRFVDDPSTPNAGAGSSPLVDMGAYEFPAASITENCCRGTTCNTVASGTCSGSVAGSNSIVRASCGSGNAFATCCYADYNHDGLQSIDDLFLYFNAYFTSNPMADFGGTGTSQPTIDDLFLYINAYFGTCS